MKRARKTFSCPQLFIHQLFYKRTVQLGETSCKRDYFYDYEFLICLGLVDLQTLSDL